MKQTSLSIAENALQVIKNKGLEREDFAGGKKRGIAQFFHDVIKYFNEEIKQFPLSNNEAFAIEIYEQGASAKAKHKENDVFDILGFLMESRREIIENYHKENEASQNRTL